MDQVHAAGKGGVADAGHRTGQRHLGDIPAAAAGEGIVGEGGDGDAPDLVLDFHVSARPDVSDHAVIGDGEILVGGRVGAGQIALIVRHDSCGRLRIGQGKAFGQGKVDRRQFNGDSVPVHLQFRGVRRIVPGRLGRVLRDFKGDTAALGPGGDRDAKRQQQRQQRGCSLHVDNSSPCLQLRGIDDRGKIYLSVLIITHF